MHNPQPRVAIQRNPISGSGRREAELARMIEGLKAAGLKPYLFSDRQKLAYHLENPAFRAHLVCIVAAGGDGTVDDLINRYPGIPLAIFAMGTENLLAKYCGIPRGGRQVAEIIAQRCTRTIDLGQVGERRFAVMASCGFDAEVVSLAHARRKGRITKLHYIKPILQIWNSYRHPALRLYCDRSTEPLACQMVIISNISRYALNLPVNPQAADHDGLFDLCTIAHATPWRLIRIMLRGLMTGRIASPGVAYHRCQHLKVEADEPVAIQADGDPVGHTPQEFRVLPHALQLLVPAAFATNKLPQFPGEIRLDANPLDA